MADRRKGDEYIITPEEKEFYNRNGYVHLKGVLSEEELSDMEKEFMAFIRREVPVEGRDFCDMSADYSKPIEDFSIINIVLPSRHQDLAYWPITNDTRTASFWLAIDNSTVENGCLHFVPGSHLEPELRDHSIHHGDRDKSHTISAKLSEKDTPKAAELKRGDATVHHERVLHGSGGNYSNSSWRRAWVIAFRSQETVEEERRRGFTHSHNDPLEVLNAVGKQN